MKVHAKGKKRFAICDLQFAIFQSKIGNLRSKITSLPAACCLLLTVFSFITFHFPLSTFHFFTPANALDVPKLEGYVNDYANMIAPQVRVKLEEKLRSFEQSDSTQLVILTIPSLQGETIEDYSIKVAEAWKIGQKGKDNGVILLVANQDRKIRIEAGRGLEGRLTDLAAGKIIDLVIKPSFKRGDFNEGFTAGIATLIDATRGEFKAEEKPRRARGGGHIPIPTLLIFGAIALHVLGRFSRIFGGIAGVIGLPLIAFLLIPAIGMVTLIVLAIGGLLMGIFLPIFGHGGGGMFWGGGGFSGTGGGDGDSGGGFDGGGGDFGGGGASGDW